MFFYIYQVHLVTSLKTETFVEYIITVGNISIINTISRICTSATETRKGSTL